MFSDLIKLHFLRQSSLFFETDIKMVNSLFNASSNYLKYHLLFLIKYFKICNSLLLCEICCKTAVYLVMCFIIWCVERLKRRTDVCLCVQWWLHVRVSFLFAHLPEEGWRWALTCFVWLWGSRAWPAAPVSSPSRAGLGVCQVSIIYRWERH